MRVLRDLLAAAALAAIATTWGHDAAAQQKAAPSSPAAPPGPSAPSGMAAPSAVDACNQFKNALVPAQQPGAQTPADRAQQSMGRIAGAGQQGIACAQALAKHFESLRKGGAKGAWSDIEREMDIVIDTYRNLLEWIEGTGGAYEEGRRAVTILEDQIKDMSARRGYNHPNVVSARRTREGITAGLEQTKTLKAKLDELLVDMQSRKSEIVEEEGIKRYSAAQKALEDMNQGLEKVINELDKVVRRPGT